MAIQFTGRDLLAAATVVVIWGTNFVAIKIGLRTFTPFQLGAARYLFAIIPLIFLVRPPNVAAKWVLIYGLVQGVAQFGLLFISMRVGMSAALASVVMQSQVFFTAILSAIFLSERIDGRQTLALLLAAIGLTFLAAEHVWPETGVPPSTSAIGLTLCIAAASMWAASNVIVRLARHSGHQFDPIAFVVWANAIPILPFAGLSYIFDAPDTRYRWLDTGWEGWIAVAYVGWGASFIAYTLWTGLIQKHGANRVAPFSLAMPAIGIASGVILLHERVTAWEWSGIVFTLLALAAILIRSPRRMR